MKISLLYNSWGGIWSTLIETFRHAWTVVSANARRDILVQGMLFLFLHLKINLPSWEEESFEIWSL
jgi:hypothetical protein